MPENTPKATPTLYDCGDDHRRVRRKEGSGPRVPSMIAAWWTAVATTLAMMFAAVAVWWARKAAIEASKQARAAIDSVEWSRKAAEAAQGQIKLLEKQLRYSEPRPLVILSIRYDQPEHDIRQYPVMIMQNLGDSTAFDIEVSRFTIRIRADKKEDRGFDFRSEFILLAGETKLLRRYGLRYSYPEDVEWLDGLVQSLREVDLSSPPDDLIRRMALERDDHEPSYGISMGAMTVRFKNSHGIQFLNTFHLQTFDEGQFHFLPGQSLVVNTDSNS